MEYPAFARRSVLDHPLQLDGAMKIFQRGKAAGALALLLGAGPACDDTSTSPTDAASDVAPDTSEAEGPVVCSTWSMCRFKSAGGQLKTQTAAVPNFCSHQKWPTHPSAGLYEICLVDPAGNGYIATIGGSVLIDMPGWTHSAYGGVVIPSTLTPAGTTLCNQALSMGWSNSCPVGDAVPDGGSDAATDADAGGDAGADAASNG